MFIYIWKAGLGVITAITGMSQLSSALSKRKVKQMDKGSSEVSKWARNDSMDRRDSGRLWDRDMRYKHDEWERDRSRRGQDDSRDWHYRDRDRYSNSNRRDSRDRSYRGGTRRSRSPEASRSTGRTMRIHHSSRRKKFINSLLRMMKFCDFCL
jgi:hypothetical protein